MTKIGVRVRRRALAALLGAAALIGPGASAVGATASPVGACCLPVGQCVAATVFDCEAQGGDFIGVDTSCSLIECGSVPLEAPLLSIFGVVAALGALLGLGTYRLVLRRES